MFLVGRVTRLWFYNKKGDPQPSVNICLIPWSTGTSIRVRRLLTRLSDPSMSEYVHRQDQRKYSPNGISATENETSDVIIASRKMTEWVNGNEIVSCVSVYIYRTNLSLH